MKGIPWREWLEILAIVYRWNNVAVFHTNHGWVLACPLTLKRKEG